MAVQLIIVFEEQEPQKTRLPEEEDLDELYAYDPEEPWWNR